MVLAPPFLPPLWPLPAGLEAVVEDPAAGVSAAIGAADFGISAAIAAAAMPTVNKAEAINLIMGSPAVGLTSDAKNTLDRRI